jgi:hypothetical protein
MGKIGGYAGGGLCRRRRERITHDRNMPCVWTTYRRRLAAKEVLDGEPTASDNRVEFNTTDSFEGLTHRARGLAERVPEPYRTALEALKDCQAASTGRLDQEQKRGASYRRLAAIGHTLGLDKDGRVKLYRLAEKVPLTDRHAGHILSRLKAREE